MTTVVDHVMPWLIPSSTLAAITHPHDGAQINRNGTGTPMIQPATSTGLRPIRSMVVTRCAPGATVQNDPAPWVGYTSSSSGRLSSRSWIETHNDLANSSVRSGLMRSVRATAPTSNDPPLNNAAGLLSSLSR